MREAFAHEARLRLEGDDAAPGAAVTVALCGHWEHDPPCPLAPHHCAVERTGSELRVRVLFATEPARETEARKRIEGALSTGRCVGPDDVSTTWVLMSAAASVVQPEEAEHARRLVES